MLRSWALTRDAISSSSPPHPQNMLLNPLTNWKWLRLMAITPPNISAYGSLKKQNKNYHISFHIHSLRSIIYWKTVKTSNIAHKKKKKYARIYQRKTRVKSIEKKKNTGRVCYSKAISNIFTTMKLWTHNNIGPKRQC